MGTRSLIDQFVSLRRSMRILSPRSLLVARTPCSLPSRPVFTNPRVQFIVGKSFANMALPNDRRPIVISGPSGVGKGTLYNRLFEQHPNYFTLSVSHTTRQPRQGESDGVHYHHRPPRISCQDRKGRLRGTRRVRGELLWHVQGNDRNTIRERTGCALGHRDGGCQASQEDRY